MCLSFIIFQCLSSPSSPHLLSLSICMLSVCTGYYILISIVLLFSFPVNNYLFPLPFFSLFDPQVLQCMLVSLHSELDIQRYLMKIESSQRVSTVLSFFCILLWIEFVTL